MHFYFVGIKGTGMSALANILVDLGYKVSGVDYNKKYFTEATFSQSIVVENFDNYHLDEKYFYIIGNAFKLADITEEIKELGYHFEYYPSFLENFFKMKKIGVSGSHGKTTTTAFAHQLIKEDINVLIGDGTGRGNKDSKYFLFEACEYQNHFLSYTFDYLVILNIDYDHPDFFKNMSEYSFAFQKAALNS
jgi:UDP-N-acetylmuramate--alanine ligase